jgi:MFS family permease
MASNTSPLAHPSGPLVQPELPVSGKGLLINRNFALLEIGQTISNLGDFIYATTLLVWVFALTHSAGAVSGVLIAQYLPVFVFGPIAGVFVDRWNRRYTMIAADTLRGIIALTPLIVPSFLLLPTLYASVFLISALSRLFMPAKSGVLQVIVPGEQQAQASSISQSTFALSFIIGPALASPLYFAVGPVIACIINAISFFVSALTIRAIVASREALHPYAYRQEEHPAAGIRPVARELFAGYRFVAKTRVLLMVVLLALIAMLGAGALNALDIVFVSQRLHASTALYGPLTAAGGIGTLIGAILAGIVARRVKSWYILTGGVLLTGVGLVIYSLQTWFVVALALNFVLGIPQGGINVGFTPLLLEATPQNMMGRVQSVIETAMFGMSLVSIGLAGYFGQFIPVNIIFTICGALILLAGVFGLLAAPTKPFFDFKIHHERIQQYKKKKR